MKENWNASEKWYTDCVGEKGHYYHQTIVLPSSLKLLGLKKEMSLLDLGCGQGVLARSIPEGVLYQGIDNSEALLQSARKLTKRPQTEFSLADACEPLPLEKKDFDRACLILSLQNMEHPDRAIQNAASHLKKGGRLLIVLNHPCFRIPRQSGWGVDEAAKLQYRRLNVYMNPLKIPIQTNPSQKEKSATTYSYHYPISSYFGWLKQAGLQVLDLQEWISDKKSEGAKAKMEDRARREIPLFLALIAVR